MSSPLLENAIAAHEKNDFASAEPLYRQHLAEKPNDFNGLSQLGLLLIQTERYQDAIIYLEQAIGLKPEAKLLYQLLGVAYKNTQQTDKAIALYQAALQHYQHDPALLNNLASAYQQKLDFAEAARYYELAYQHDATQTAILDNLIQCYFNWGCALFETRKFDVAIEKFEKVLTLDSQHVGAHCNIANCYWQTGQWRDAVNHYQTALKHKDDPNLARVHNNLACLLTQMDELDQAQSHFKQALVLNPDYTEAYNNFGGWFEKQNLVNDAMTFYKKALQLNPDYAEAYNNIGNIEKLTGNINAAMQHYDKALALNPKLANALNNKGQLLLLQQDYEQGWPNYLARLYDPKLPLLRPFGYAHWQGEDLTHKTILVWGEQGLGDEIAFAVWLKPLIQQAQQVIVECEPRLVTLFQRAFPELMVIPRENPPHKTIQQQPIDYQCPMGNLGYYLHWPKQNKLTQASYLIAEPEKVKQLKQKYQTNNKQKLIGFAWHSGNLKLGPQRSMALEKWLPILTTPNCQFVNLQYGDHKAELEKLQHAQSDQAVMTIINDHDINASNNITELANQIAALDLVITIDNSTAHLACALGIPTWVLLPTIPDWRWQAQGDRCDWYPSARLFRQSELGDWQPVIDQVVSSLRG